MFCSKIFVFIFTSILLFQVNSYLSNEETPIPLKVIAFDLGGVLIDTNKKAIVNKLGIVSLALYKIKTGNSPSHLKRVLYNILHTMQPHTHHVTTYDDEGLPIPELMYDWLCSNTPNKVIYKKIKTAIKEHPEWFCNSLERLLIKRLAHTIFNPHQFAQTRTLNKEGITFVRKCKEQGYRVYILSNWDAESFKLLQALYPEFFDLFDRIIISGNHQCAKPETTLYQELLSDGTRPQEILFIDDQEENRHAAQQLGMHTLSVPRITSYFGFSSKPNFEYVQTAFTQAHYNQPICRT